MDADMLKGNLKRAIGKMPPELQLDFAKLWTGVEKHLATFERIGPEIMDIMGNDVMSIAVEWQCKMLDKDALSKIVHEAFAESGIMPQDAPKPQG